MDFKFKLELRLSNFREPKFAVSLYFLQDLQDKFVIELFL